VPKRKIKEATPRKRMGKKDLFLLPAVIGGAILIGFIITHFFPPPNVLSVCLKAHNLDPYNVYPKVQLFVDNKQYLFPDTLGKGIEKGKECLKVIHADFVGDLLHVQYIRPIKLSMPDLMQIYSPDTKTIIVIDNSTGKYLKRTLDLSKFNLNYSYYSVTGNFTKINKAADSPPFSNSFLGRIDLVSK
jgi:hypothetical protein